jgi:hypothetical protein
VAAPELAALKKQVRAVRESRRTSCIDCRRFGGRETDWRAAIFPMHFRSRRRLIHRMGELLEGVVTSAAV